LAGEIEHRSRNCTWLGYAQGPRGPTEGTWSSDCIECGHLRQQRAVRTGMGQLVSAAKYMGELVMQTHRGAAKCPAG
jgi:hypothetical protein